MHGQHVSLVKLCGEVMFGIELCNEQQSFFFDQRKKNCNRSSLLTSFSDVDALESRENLAANFHLHILLDSARAASAVPLRFVCASEALCY